MKEKKKNSSLLQPEERYQKFEVSPTSQFFLYGKGSNDDYFGEVRRVKNELRELAYGNVYNYNKEIETVAKKRINIASAVVLATTIAAFIFAVAGIIFNEGLFLTADGASIVDAIKPLFSGSTDAVVIGSAFMDFRYGGRDFIRSGITFRNVVCLRRDDSRGGGKEKNKNGGKPRWQIFTEPVKVKVSGGTTTLRLCCPRP